MNLTNEHDDAWYEHQYFKQFIAYPIGSKPPWKYYTRCTWSVDLFPRITRIESRIRLLRDKLTAARQAFNDPYP